MSIYRRIEYNFNCIFESEGLMKVTGRHVHYKINVVVSQKRFEQDGVVVTYRPLIASDHDSHGTTALSLSIHYLVCIKHK